MKFPNAYTGVKKLFVAELMAIVAALVMFFSAILAAVGATNDALLVTAGTLVLISSIALIIAYIVQLVGLHQAGKDEAQIRTAFIFMIVGLILGVVSAILSNFTSTYGLNLVVGLIDAGKTGVEVCAAYYTLLGIATLASRVNNEKMAKEGRTLSIFVIVFFALQIVLNLYPKFIGSGAPEWLIALVNITAIIAALAKLVVYIVTFIYYYKATRMLEKYSL